MTKRKPKITKSFIAAFAKKHVIFGPTFPGTKYQTIRLDDMAVGEEVNADDAKFRTDSMTLALHNILVKFAEKIGAV